MKALNSSFFYKNIIAYIYYAIICIIFLIKVEGSTLSRIIFWHGLWFFIKSMQISAGVGFDVALVLQQNGTLTTDVVIANLNHFPLFSNVFCMEDSATKVGDPCKSFVEEMSKCIKLSNNKNYALEAAVQTAPILETLKEADTNYRVGKCALNLAEMHKECINSLKKK